MADAYLNIAERVLLTARRPLRPREVISQAHAAELLPWHLHGSRQDKTLHARMSEDIARNPEESRFFRTKPGIFFLRKFLKDPLIPESYKQTYFAPPRRKELRRDRILCFNQTSNMATANPPFINICIVDRELKYGRYSYLSFEEVTRRKESAAAHSFVMVFYEDKVLSYRCGKFAPSSDPLLGMRSIGLGGAVYASDRDLLFDSMFGIVGSGINQLGYGIGLSRQLSERARYESHVRPYLGVVLPGLPTRPAILHIVMGYECPPEFLPSKGALSVNELRWIDPEKPANSLDDFDLTSRLLLESNFVARLRAKVALDERG